MFTKLSLRCTLKNILKRKMQWRVKPGLSLSGLSLESLSYGGPEFGWSLEKILAWTRIQFYHLYIDSSLAEMESICSRLLARIFGKPGSTSLAIFKVLSWTELRLGVSGSNPSLGKWISNTIWLDCPPPNSLDKAQDSPQYSLHFDGLWLNHVCKSLDWRWNKSQLAKMEASNDDILEAKEIPPY